MKSERMVGKERRKWIAGLRIREGGGRKEEELETRSIAEGRGRVRTVGALIDWGMDRLSKIIVYLFDSSFIISSPTSPRPPKEAVTSREVVRGPVGRCQGLWQIHPLLPGGGEVWWFMPILS